MLILSRTKLTSALLAGLTFTTMAPAMAAPATRGLLPDLIQVAGKPSLSVPLGSDTCKEAVSRYGGICVYRGGANPPDFPNGKYGYIHQVELR